MTVGGMGFIPECLLMMMMMMMMMILETTIVNQLLHADSISRRPRPVGRPHYTWKDGAMQDLSALGSRPPPRLAEAGTRPGAVEGGYQPVLVLSVLIDTSLLRF